MNSLSILIYVASIVQGFTGMLFFLALAILAVTLVHYLAIVNYNNDNKYIRYKGREDKEYPKVAKPISLAVALMFIVNLTPNKETIYLIAGSEAGEYVVNTPEAQEILTDIHTIIKQQIEETIHE